MGARKVGITLLSLSLATIALAADSATTKPSAVKIVKPYDELTTLTDDQKQQIHDIHEKANEEREAITKKEKADIMALLTDDQKAELKKEHEAELSEAKMKKTATTEPSH